MKKAAVVIAIFGLLGAANLAGAQGLVVTYPFGGGPITISNNGAAVVQTNGVDFASAAGGLTFTSAAPYTFPLLNTPNAVTLAVIPGSVDYEPGQSIELGVSYSGERCHDLMANFGILGMPTPIAFPICRLDEDPVNVTASPVRGSTLDFGLVARGDVSAFRLTDAIKITRSFPATAPELTHFEFTGASVFDVPDFAPIILSDAQPEVEFDLALDIAADPGNYEAVLSFFGDSFEPVTYSLTAQVVPEPSSQTMLGLAWLLLLIFRPIVGARD